MPSELAEKIRAALPQDGTSVGNIGLIRKLGVTPEAYVLARAELEAQGAIIRGVGRGGSIRLTPKEVAKSAGPKAVVGVKDESDLYKPLKDWFDRFWGSEYVGGDFYACKITGPPKGHKRNSGKWSRPDLSIVTVATSEFFVPSKTLEVTTVEVKRYPDISVVAVFEAASHRKFGHQCYVAVEWLETDDMDSSGDGSVAYSLLREARNFGVGVLQMRPKSGTWDITEALAADRKNPEPQVCSQFIEEQFSDKAKELRIAIK
jgi:hypothetical protein